jgi:hypothetical protein
LAFDRQEVLVRQGDRQLFSAKLVALTAAAVAPLLLVGCGGGGGTAQGNGNQGGGSKSAQQEALCNSLNTLNKGLTDLDNLDPKTASNADIQAAATEVRAANAKVQAAAKNVSQTQATTVALAASRLVAAVKAVPPGTSPQQTLEQVEPVLKSTKTQFQASYNGLACSSTG